MKLNRRAFLNTSILGAIQLGLLPELYASVNHSLLTQKGVFPRSSPEIQGIKSGAILNFLTAIEKSNALLHSLMIVRNGHVVAEGWWAPYAPEYKHTLYSLSKSFTSTAIGLAVAEKRLSVHDQVISFFPEQKPLQVSEKLAAMRVRDLLSMTTGHEKDTTSAFRNPDNKDWVKAFLAQPVTRQPGTHFVYNSGATYMLSAILHKLTGQTLLDYLTPRLFEPLGITDMDWEVDPAGINVGGWGLRLKTEDIAKFGQLYLQEGKWNEKQIIPANWVKEATLAHILQPGKDEDRDKSDWLQGYGYQFWRCRNNAYRGDGAYGQYCVVIPEKQMVVAITSETPDLQIILDHVWEHLIPEGNQKLGTDNANEKLLSRRLSNLAVQLPQGLATARTVSKVNARKYELAANALGFRQVTFQFSPNEAVLKLSDERGEHSIPVGINKWKAGKTHMNMDWIKLIPTPIPGNVALNTMTTGNWTDQNTFEITLRYIDTAHYQTLVCKFDKRNVKVEIRKSLALISRKVEPDMVLEGRQI